MKNDPTISVVMSVFNGEQYLAEAIESILKQSYRDFEFIIVDDGSTDASIEILKAYTDNRIIVCSQENIGLPSALNLGISIARGQYIARMDADDIALPDRLKIQYQYMREYDDLDIIGGQAWLVNEKNEAIEELIKPIGRYDIKRYMEYCCPLIHPTYLVKKSVYQELGGYRKIFKTAQDYDFILRASEAGYQIDNVADKLLLYRKNPNALSSVDAQRQMYYTRCILHAHRLRLRGQNDQRFLESVMQKKICTNSRLFNYCLEKRTKFMSLSRKTVGMKKKLFMLAAVFSSCGHFEVFLSTLRIYFSAKWNKGLKSNLFGRDPDSII